MANIADFLEDIAKDTDKTVDLHKDTTPLSSKSKNHQLHKPTKSRLYKSTSTENISTTGKERIGRLHIDIRQDLADRLLEMVYQRKRNPNIKGRVSTQRAIIEEALEQYFKDYRLE